MSPKNGPGSESTSGRSPSMIAALRAQFDRFFDHVSQGPWDMYPVMGDLIDTTRSNRFTPTVDVLETETHVVVHAEVPGVDPNALKVKVKPTMVVLKGKKPNLTERHPEASLEQTENKCGEFKRQIDLPARVEPKTANTEYSHGVVTITINKAEDETSDWLPVKVVG